MVSSRCHLEVFHGVVLGGKGGYGHPPDICSLSPSAFI